MQATTARTIISQSCREKCPATAAGSVSKAITSTMPTTRSRITIESAVRQSSNM